MSAPAVIVGIFVYVAIGLGRGAPVGFHLVGADWDAPPGKSDAARAVPGLLLGLAWPLLLSLALVTAALRTLWAFFVEGRWPA